MQRDYEKIPAYEVCSFATKLAFQGKWEQAKIIANKIKDPNQKGQAIASIALRLFEAGLIEKSKNLILTLNVDATLPDVVVEKIMVLINIASYYIEKKHQEKAIHIVEVAEKDIAFFVNGFYEKAQILSSIAKIWCKLDYKTKALELWKEAFWVVNNLLKEDLQSGGTGFEEKKTILRIIRDLKEENLMFAANEITLSICEPETQEKAFTLISVKNGEN